MYVNDDRSSETKDKPQKHFHRKWSSLQIRRNKQKSELQPLNRTNRMYVYLDGVHIASSAPPLPKSSGRTRKTNKHRRSLLPSSQIILLGEIIKSNRNLILVYIFIELRKNKRRFLKATDKSILYLVFKDAHKATNCRIIVYVVHLKREMKDF